MRARLAMWLAALVTVAFLFGQTTHEAHVREHQSLYRDAQLCQVVTNVHNNALDRAKIEHETLSSTKDYLADPDSRDSKALYTRVKANLPVIKARVKAADENVTATAVPKFCTDHTKGMTSNAAG